MFKKLGKINVDVPFKNTSLFKSLFSGIRKMAGESCLHWQLRFMKNNLLKTSYSIHIYEK